jgi:hypothetical protein
MPSEILQVAAETADTNFFLAAGTDKVTAINQPDDDSTSYIYGTHAFGSSEVHQSFSFPDTAIGSGLENPTVTINKITVYTRIRNHNGSLTNKTQARLKVRLGLSGSWTSDASNTLDENWGDKNNIFTTRPDAAAWTLSDLNNLEVSVAASGQNSTTVSGCAVDLTTLYIVIDYSYTETPNDPDNLTISDIDSNFVELTWDDNSGIEDHFEIQRSLDGVTWTTLVTLDPDIETYTDHDVASVTHYYYRIRAYNAGATSGWSATADDTTPAYSGPALTPTSPSYTNLTNTSVDIHWTDGGSTDTFEVQRSADAGSTWTTIATLPKETTFYTDGSKLPGSTYQYKVRGVNTVGNSSYTSAVTVLFPERSFRDFLQNEVLQDVAKYFDWIDRVKLVDQEFSVTQTFHIATNMTAEEMRGATNSVFVHDPQTFNVTRTFPAVSTVKLSEQLLTPLATGSVLFYTMRDPSSVTGVPTIADALASLPASGGGKTYFKVMVDQNPAHLSQFGDVLVDGAAIGDKIMYLKQIQVNRDTAATIGSEEPYLMRMWDYYDGAFRHLGMGTILSRNITVTRSIDYSVQPHDAAPVYEGMTNEALLRIGYTEEVAVPDETYQQFRDAGRVAAWRAVAYSTVHLIAQSLETATDEFGSADLVDFLNQIHAMALAELTTAESIYATRYISTASSTPAEPIVKPVRQSSSSAIIVRF